MSVMIIFLIIIIVWEFWLNIKVYLIDFILFIFFLECDSILFIDVLEEICYISIDSDKLD